MRQGVIYSQNTNVHPVFASAYKAAGIRRRIVEIFTLHAHPMQSGPKPINLAFDPFKRDPRYLAEMWRLNASAGGQRRGNIYPAASGLVKYQKGNQGYNAVTRRPIGPVNQDTQKSVLSRISTTFQQYGG